MSMLSCILKRSFHGCYSIHQSARLILGIESSCDDTGCAIVTSSREILGECVISQQEEVRRLGGIMPLIAKELHEQNIDTVVENTLHQANLTVNDLDAIAVTTQPGLVMSLLVGLNYAKNLSQKYEKNFIPIHHMEAHALVSRLINKDLQFPYLTFLISGGHCLLAIVHSVNKFVLLGKSIDDAPGEVFDKVARRLKIFNLPKYNLLSGGAAIEDAAVTGDPSAFKMPIPLLHFADCNFSLAGIKSHIRRIIIYEEKKYGLVGDAVLPSINDVCASFQYCIAKHLCMRLQRAMEFIVQRNMLPENHRMLVISGGVACNSYMSRAFQIVCEKLGFTLYVPPAKYCTDNGAMIAWNGIEKFHHNIDVLSYNQLSRIIATPNSPLGEDISKDVRQAKIKCKWIKLNELLCEQVAQETVEIVENK